MNKSCRVYNVPGASLVVLAVLLSSLGLPVEGIAIIAGIDYFGGMGRTTINVFGNTVAALALCKWGEKNKKTVTAFDSPVESASK